MKFSEWLVKATEESPGVISALRLVVVAGLLAIIVLFSVACVWHRMLVEIPGSVLAFAGMLLGAKVGQAITENKTPPAP